MLNNIIGNGYINTPKIPNTPIMVAITKLAKTCIAILEEFSVLVLNKLGLNKQSRVFIVNTEGNTDPKHFRRIIWDGQDPVPREYRTRR